MNWGCHSNIWLIEIWDSFMLYLVFENFEEKCEEKKKWKKKKKENKRCIKN